MHAQGLQVHATGGDHMESLSLPPLSGYLYECYLSDLLTLAPHPRQVAIPAQFESLTWEIPLRVQWNGVPCNHLQVPFHPWHPFDPCHYPPRSHNPTHPSPPPHIYTRIATTCRSWRRCVPIRPRSSPVLPLSCQYVAHIKRPHLNPTCEPKLSVIRFLSGPASSPI